MHMNMSRHTHDFLIVGPVGTGKTTLLHALLAQLDSTTNSAEFVVESSCASSACRSVVLPVPTGPTMRKSCVCRLMFMCIHNVVAPKIGYKGRSMLAV